MPRIVREEPKAHLPFDATTLVQLLQWRAGQRPSKRAYTFLIEGEEESDSLSYLELDRQARAIGAWLQSIGAFGQRVVLLYPSGSDYLKAFFGCLYAGAVAVPVYPPRHNRNVLRLQAIVADAEAMAALTTTSVLSSIARHFEHSPDLRKLHWLSTDGAVDFAGQWKEPDLRSDDLAFLQYTSGSTATPKGVMVSHGNLLHNASMIWEAGAGDLSWQSVMVSWLPLYHDMGLIGIVLQSLYCGAHCVLMPPAAFLQRPLRWLRAISRYRGTYSGAPNFAYDLCVRKSTHEERATLDLSSWRVAFNGAEPVRHQTLERFIKTFGACGFRREAMHPTYGLAEATLLVSVSPIGSMPGACTAQRSALEENRTVLAPEASEGSLSFVSCGRTWGGQKLIIADPQSGAECPDGQVGEIWLSGAGVAQGYWNRARETEQTFGAQAAKYGKMRFLRTGDLGFVRDGDLYFAGRLKDLIIIRGRNHYPQDIELTVEQCDAALRSGCGAAFTVDADAEERLIIVQEVERTAIRNLNVEDVVRKIREAVADQHEIEVGQVILIKPGTISKTSSGKIQRRATQERYLNGGLEIISERGDQQSNASMAVAEGPAREAGAPAACQRGAGNGMEFSLFYFSSADAEFTSDKYRLFLEGAKFADTHGFTAVWTPERHFHAFGGLYPNPAVLSSALAMTTERVRLRAGSVVLPLHNPIRVAEEWSVVDNLSRGRVDLAFARGWNPNDFVLCPKNFANNRDVLFSEIDTVRRLWRGEKVMFENGVGEESEIGIFPLPRQREIELWVTCSGGVERFIEAGERGYNVLTALLFQPIEELAQKITAYRDARARSGHDPETGRVTLMLHTFVGDDLELVRDQVRGPFIEYLKSSVNLWSNRSEGLQGLSEKEQEELLSYAFERYFRTSALFGTPETCLPTVERLAEIGVREIACLIDFGVDADRVLEALPALDNLRRLFNGVNEVTVASESDEPSRRAADRGAPVTARPCDISALKQERPEPGAGAAPDHHSLLHWLRAGIIQQVAAVLRIDPQSVALDRSFHSLGVDSLKAVEIVDRLGEELGVAFSSTLLFSSPTIAELADHLAERHLPALTARFKKDDAAIRNWPADGANDAGRFPQSAGLLSESKSSVNTVETAGDQVSEGEIAIVGMACRFPQSPNLDSYWDLLRRGRSAVREVPPDHWDWREHFDENQRAENKSYSRWGGFLDGIDLFDPEFFNLSPREARLMDPQQRLFLEVAWETLEHAGYSAEKLAQTDVGVFVGCSNNGYYQRIAATLTSADHSAGIGNQNAIIAGRVSYHLNLHGPSIMIDTMCSSSLVAVHLACQSLRLRECSAAIVGGVNVLISPEYFVGMSRIKALSPDGRCQAFDQRANGIALGEGAGAVMLKPLRRAIEDGDTIYAVIKGSAVNHGGQANGLTAPNPRAQARLVRSALNAAKISAETISYVEAHGTGTSLGDPIEIEGLTTAFRQDTDLRQFCAIGSVKTNIGHLEPAAGVASLIKVALAMRHHQIPPSINFDKPNPIIPFAETPFRVNTELSSWNPKGPRRAGVSAFGMSGTNAHVIVEEAPDLVPTTNEAERPLHLFALSAKTETALRTLAHRYEKVLAEDPSLDLANLCYTANLSRSSFPGRIILPTETTAQLRAALAAYARRDGLRGHHGATLSGPQDDVEVVFLFTGQGSQYPDMGRRLYETQPVFREAIERCDRLLRPHLERPLLSALYPTPGETSLIAETAYAQPAIFALEYALAQLWISWGIKPAAALGHSIGEYTAACIAGVFSVEDGLRLVADRGRLMQSLSNNGKMVAVFSGEAQVIEALTAFPNDVSIAAVNGLRSVIISGAIEAVDAAVIKLEREGVTTQDLNASRAFHSPLMDPILDAFEESARTVQYFTPRIQLISNLTGLPVESGTIPGASYWRRHIREAVRFEAGINLLGSRGYRVFIEIGSMPTLINLGRRCFSDPSALWLASLKQGQDEWRTMTGSLSKLYLKGVKIDWEGFDRPYNRRRMALPTYPFERKRCWVDPVKPEHRKQNNLAGAGESMESNNLLSTRPRENGRVKGNVSEVITSSAYSAAPRATRKEEALEFLRGFLSRVLEAETSEIDIFQPFLEMGADSLVLIEAVQAIQGRFGIKLELRQLFEECNTLDTLAGYIDRHAPFVPAVGAAGTQLPKEITAPEIPVQSHVTAHDAGSIGGAEAFASLNGSSFAGSVGGLGQLMALQLSAFSQLTARQLAVLSDRPSLENGNRTPDRNWSIPVDNAAGQSVQERPSPPAHISRNATAMAEDRGKEETPWLPYQPLNPGTIEELNPRQHQYLSAFIERYVRRTQESKRMTQFYRSVHADLRTSAGIRLCTKEMRYPIIGARSEGSKLWDVDGNEYVDYAMGYGVHLFGHGAPFITDALNEQMRKGIQLGPQTELAGEVAALISELTGMDRVTFANTGTEAVMAALRLARVTTRRNKVVIFAGSYHGTSDGVLVIGQVKDGVDGALPMAPGIPSSMAEEVIVLNYGSPRSLEIIKSRAHELAAVLVEPVQSRRPDLQPTEFLRQLRHITQEAGVLLIFDEVITGFRIHPGGAQSWFGVRADLACYGKIIGGGMPIGAIAGRADVMSGIDGGVWRFGDLSMPGASTTLYTGTFCKHPLAMAAARAVLNRIKDQGPELYTQLNRRATRLVEALNQYCEEDQIPIRVVQYGSLFRLNRSHLLRSPDAMDLLFYHIVEKGIYVWEGRNWFVSTVHTDTDLEALSDAFKQSVAEMREGGFLPDTDLRPPAGRLRANAGPDDADGAEAGRTDSASLAMTETQSRLWFLSQASEGDSGAYHQSVAIRLRGPLRLQAMRRAFQQVVDRHEALRTTFDQGERQHIRSSGEIDVPLVDFSGCQQQEQEARIEEWLKVEEKRSFNLEEGPLLRVCLLKLEEEHHLLVITAHHLVTDGWSISVILKEAGSFYSAECEGKAAELPRPVQFREFVEWQNAESRRAERNEAEEYWLKRLVGSETVSALPADRPRPLVPSSAGARLHTTLDRSLSASLTTLSAREGCTPFMTLFAAYRVLTYQLTSQEDSVIVIPTAGQSRADSAHLIGDCDNLLPMRTKIAPDASFSSYLASVKNDLLNGYRSLDFPFASLVSKLDPPQDPSRWPFFNIDKPLASQKFFELKMDFVQVPIGQTNFDLSLNITQLGDELDVAFDYKTDLFEGKTIQGWLNHFEGLLRVLIAFPTIRISALPLPVFTKTRSSALSNRLPEIEGETIEAREYSHKPTERSLAELWTEPIEDGRAYATRNYEPPVGETETLLARIWAEVLKLKRVDRHDNFFQLGGNSLLAVTLMARMRREGLQTDPRTLLTAPSLRALAKAVAGGGIAEVKAPPNLIPLECRNITPEMLPLVTLTEGEIDSIVAGVPGGAANVKDIYPLAPLQEGLLFHHLMSLHGDAYLLRALLAFDTRERLEGFLQALQRVIDRHDILRTAVVWEGLPEPVQVVWRNAPLAVEDVGLDPFGSVAAEQLRARFDPRRVRLDVRQAPMMRCIIAHDEANGRWLLLWLSHHLATDHTSLEIMVWEAQAYLLGEVDQLPAPLPFRNFVAQARLEIDRAEHEAFFRAMLGDVEEPTVPFGLLDARDDGSDLEEKRIELSAILARRLRGRAQALGVSAASICHLAWACVLARISGRNDVVFGTVLSGRMRGGQGVERTLGLFINTLPVRIRIDEQGVERNVRQTHALLADLARHEHASLMLAQRCSAVAAPTPLFSSLFNYMHGPREAGPSSEAKLAWAGIEVLGVEERTHYPLMLAVDDLGDGFEVIAQAVRPVDPGRICNFMLTALERLIEDLEKVPETKMRAVDVLPEAERDQILTEWNATRTEYPKEKCVHELFEAQVEKTPDAVALIHQDRKLSYGELNACANRLAHYLSQLGVQPGARVALCIEHSLDMVVGLLATLKAGGVYVPLDQAYPPERLARILEDSAPVVLLTYGETSAALIGRSLGVRTIDLHADSRSWAAQSALNPDRTDIGLDAENLAYIIYTSGSTGLPKGVMVGHRGIVNLLCSMRDIVSVGPTDCVLALTTLAFDIAGLELYLPLICGGRIALLDRAKSRDPEVLAKMIAESGATVVQATPATWRMLLDAGWDGAPGLKALCGGEALPTELGYRLVERVGKLWNVYGPTETTIWSSVEQVEARTATRTQAHESIGRPVANTQIYILNGELEPSPVGVSGEIYIGGAGMAWGYLNRPELTGERFLPDPFSQEPGARIYKTGDLGRWSPEGKIEFQGRNDFQIKIRGFRIELGEIEANLSSHPKVREALVIASDDEEGGKRLIAYYTGEEIGAKALRDHLSSALPEYLAPSAYVYVDAFPLMPNGKLSRRALPLPGDQAIVRRGDDPPVGEIETHLARIWAEVLKVERVGRHDNFFELGGHSLLATRLISRIKQEMAVDIPLADVFRLPELALLADCIVAARLAQFDADDHSTVANLSRYTDRARSTRIPKLNPAARHTLPLSFAQERLWFIDQLEPGNIAYNIPGALLIKGRLGVRALQASLSEIVRRHEALRTTFTSTSGQPVQVVGEVAPVSLPITDLEAVPDANRMSSALQQAIEEVRQPFDLSSGPLLRARLFRLDEDEHLLVITIHHIVSDGWSLGILVSELAALYKSFSSGKPSSLPELELQYGDYSVWQRERLQGEVLEEQVIYWRRKLAGAPLLTKLPIDTERQPKMSFRGGCERFVLPVETTEDLKELSRREGVTFFMTLLAALQTLLYRYSGQEDLIVGTDVANRNLVETEGLIGFFVNLLALRTDLSGDPSFRELLGRVKETTLEAYAHQDVPFGKVIEVLQPKRGLTQTPFVQVLCVLQNAPMPPLGLGDLQVSQFPLDGGTSEFELILDMEEGEKGLSCALKYNADLFERETITMMIGKYRRLLGSVAKNPDQPLSAIQLLTETESGGLAVSDFPEAELSQRDFENLISNLSSR